MSEILTRDLVRNDPLTEITRKERRALLGSAVLGIALVKVPLVPSKLSAFGLDFDAPNQRTLLALYALVVGYFLVAFLVYALTDYVAWRRSQVIFYREYIRQDELVRKSLGVKAEKEALRKWLEEGCPYRGFASHHMATLASGLRAAFEFLVPIAVAAYAIAILLAYVPRP